MYLNELLREKNMTKYKLAKASCIPMTTIVDICSGKAKITKCSAATIYKIAKALDVSMESLIEPEFSKTPVPRRTTFDVYKSNVCHLVKHKGDIDFLLDVLSSDEIRTLYEQEWYAEALYLLAMVDYLSRLNNIPLCNRYNDLRSKRLKEPIYPLSARLADELLKTESHCKTCLDNAIPEFLKFNIIEGEIRNVC